MKVDIRLFAVFRERAGRDRLELELVDGATVADALTALGAESGLGELLSRMPVRVALNREYVAEDAAIEPGDELALIPPVSGGATATGPRIVVRVTGEPLSLESTSAAVADPAAGAIVSFQGTTREVERLEYEAYREMAEERIEAILRECADRHDLVAAAAEHRVGSVALGEPSVIVAASSAHRPEAFAGAREAIDRIKAEAPIWKKEIDGDSERWVEGERP
jgi:molybdopterin synthase catalytic subunit